MNESAQPVRAEDVAADWVVRINDPEVTEAELSDWQAWLEEDPRHCDLYRRLDQAWSRAAQLPAQPPIRVRPRVLSWKVAASIALLVTGALAAGWIQQHRAKPIETSTAEQRSLRLDDGSRLELAAESAVVVDIGERQRTLRLQRGEAYFDVAHDASRPFVVVVGDHQVRALGTAFNIEKASRRVVISVTEGLVQLSAINGGGSEGALNLKAGEQAFIDEEGMRRAPATADAQSAAAWREGRLVYLQEQLRYVLEDVNRYAKRKVVVNDPRLAELEFTGTVFLDHLDEWLETLQGTFPVRVVERPGARELIRQAARE